MNGQSKEIIYYRCKQKYQEKGTTRLVVKEQTSGKQKGITCQRFLIAVRVINKENSQIRYTQKEFNYFEELWKDRGK